MCSILQCCRNYEVCLYLLCMYILSMFTRRASCELAVFNFSIPGKLPIKSSVYFHHQVSVKIVEGCIIFHFREQGMSWSFKFQMYWLRVVALLLFSFLKLLVCPLYMLYMLVLYNICFFRVQVILSYCLLVDYA